MNQTQSSVGESRSEAPLEDIMVAMDVVDTLRHEQSIAQRELDQEGRRERLLERLREMYKAQGIDVPDHVLEEGIAALEEERFQYKAPPSNWSTRLARIWVRRSKWGKPLGFLSVLGGLFYGVYFATDVMPERALKAELPNRVDAAIASIINEAKNPDIIASAQDRAKSAHLAIEQNEYEEAQLVLSDLESVERRLKQAFDIRIISRANENSGVWRLPPNNSKVRNYYLIVEAVDANNRVLELDIVNEENNKVERRKTWGIRVNETTFYRVAADKKDDGIIQSNKVGIKRRGYLEPEFNIATTGATITDW